MKTVTNGKIVKRVDDITAQENVKKGWQYCPKSSWKTLLRSNTSVQADVADWKCKKCNWFSAADLQNCVQCGSPRR